MRYIIVSILLSGLLVSAAAAGEKKAPSRTERLGRAIPASAKATPFSDLEGDPHDLEGRSVLLEGLIGRQCGHGRWFWISSASAGEAASTTYRCGCTGKTWTQPAGEKKSCPFCGDSMPDCGSVVGDVPQSSVYVDSSRLPIPPRAGRRVRVMGIVAFPQRKNPGPWLVPAAIEILPPESKPVSNRWKCGCTGKTWEQPAEEKKACPYCGEAMPDCGTLLETTTAPVEETPAKAGCAGCEEGASSGGCGGCGGGKGGGGIPGCSKDRCKNCRGDDPAGTCCRPIEPAAAKSGGAQTKCPVMGGAINRSIHADHEGFRVFFCCPGCIEAFKRDPARYLAKIREAGEEPERLK